MTVYRLPKKGPIKVGQLRSMAWSAILPPVVAQDDPVWAKRCQDYWQRQQRLFGVKMSDFTMVVDAAEGVVATWAVVMEVLPGERTSDWSRVQAEANA